MHTTHHPSPITRNLAEIHAFSSKERDVETGLSYFGARYYSSDLSIWLSVDPMVDKYPSLSSYVYCANNPVKLVDPNGEEAIDPDDPPKRNFFQKIGDGLVKLDKSLEGHSDVANKGTITKQDVEVSVAVVATMLSAGLAIEAETVAATTISVISTVNNIDDATVNSSGQTASQRIAPSNPSAQKNVNYTKAAVSAVSAVSSTGAIANNVTKEAAKNGLVSGLKNGLKKTAANVADVAYSTYSAFKSLFIKKKK